MIKKALFLNILLLGGLLFFVSGCGYKPASYHTRKSLGKKIYTRVEIPVTSPEYAVVITDAVKEAVVTRFKGELVDNRWEADSTIEIISASHSIEGIQTDKQGVTVMYRATVTLKAEVYGKNFPRKVFDVVGRYNFPADKGSALSNQYQLNAIKQASRKALDELLSKVALRSI